MNASLLIQTVVAVVVLGFGVVQCVDTDINNSISSLKLNNQTVEQEISSTSTTIPVNNQTVEVTPTPTTTVKPQLQTQTTTTTTAPVEVSIYSERERTTIENFRKYLMAYNTTMHDYQWEDHYLIRWLRARNLDVELASRMLWTAQKWRKHNGIDNILQETIASFSPLPYRISGASYEGNPIIMFTPTSLDLRALLIGGKNISRYWDQIMEEASGKLRQIRRESGKPITQVISLMDLHGFNLRQHGCLACFGVYIDWITDYENYYPQLAKHIVWINAPRVFVAVLELVKPLMSPATSKALRVFGTNRQEWAPYLHKLIPKDQLTFRFGGVKKA